MTDAVEKQISLDPAVAHSFFLPIALYGITWITPRRRARLSRLFIYIFILLTRKNSFHSFVRRTNKCRRDVVGLRLINHSYGTSVRLFLLCSFMNDEARRRRTRFSFVEFIKGTFFSIRFFASFLLLLLPPPLSCHQSVFVIFYNFLGHTSTGGRE